MTNLAIKRAMKRKWWRTDYDNHRTKRQKYKREYMRNYRTNLKLKLAA